VSVCGLDLNDFGYGLFLADIAYGNEMFSSINVKFQN